MKYKYLRPPRPRTPIPDPTTLSKDSREYTMPELYLLSKWCEADLKVRLTADVHESHTFEFDVDLTPAQQRSLIDFRQNDSPQQLFTRSVKNEPGLPQCSSWLFSSYDPKELALQ